jgi:hypothetical protein
MTDDTKILAEYGRGAAMGAWARLKDEAPSYPPLTLWLALVAQLRADGRTDLLGHEGQRIFVEAYEREMRLLKKPDAWDPR